MLSPHVSHGRFLSFAVAASAQIRDIGGKGRRFRIMLAEDVVRPVALFARGSVGVVLGDELPVRAALIKLADLGVALPKSYETPDEFIAEIRKTAPNEDLDALIEQTVKQAPNVVAAEAQIEQAAVALAEAELNLSYCKIYSEIDGFVANRNVNPGDRAAQGQRLLAVRAFEDVWIDCNFKETQLEPIRIGQPVDLTLDAYPGKHFRGRVSGFSPGTGATMALLPPQNATGNFVKIVQRLPVRVDLVGGNPPDTPLFAGLSAAPRVRIYDRPEGPGAGQRLRGNFPRVETRRAPLSGAGKSH